MLRQEVYALDDSANAAYPYSVLEQSFTIRTIQPMGDNRHAVFFAHPREALTFHYERNPADPRVQQALTLETDGYGNVLKSAAVGYGRRAAIKTVDALGNVTSIVNPGLAALAAEDQAKQTATLMTYTENRVSNAIESTDSQRNPVTCEMRTFELTGYVPTGAASRFEASDLIEVDLGNPGALRHIFLKEFPYEETSSGAQARRVVEWARTLYRKDDLTSLSPLGELESAALRGESYKLAFTPGLLDQVFQRPRSDGSLESLLPDPGVVLGGEAGDRGWVCA